MIIIKNIFSGSRSRRTNAYTRDMLSSEIRDCDNDRFDRHRVLWPYSRRCNHEVAITSSHTLAFGHQISGSRVRLFAEPFFGKENDLGSLKNQERRLTIHQFFTVVSILRRRGYHLLAVASRTFRQLGQSYPTTHTSRFEC